MDVFEDGINSAQFIEYLNANFAEERYDISVATITSSDGISDINSNFSTIKDERKTFVPDITTIIPGSGQAFKNTLNSNFANVIVPMRDFSGITKYEGNPTIPRGTYSFGTVAVITSTWIRIENKIGDTWHGLVQTGSLSYFVHVTSTDLINWTVGAKVIERTPGNWDDHYTVSPNIIKIDDLWYCYYSAKNAAVLDQIGLATSSDFVTWTKYGTDPVFLSSQDSDRNVGMPNVIKIGDTYFMYYCSYITETVDFIVKYATSPDGINWTYGGVALTNVTGDWSDTFIDPFVIKNLQGYYEMVFCASGLEVDAQNMGYAISDDGIHWIKRQTIILTIGEAGQFDDYQIGNACILENPDGTAYIYYTGTTAETATADGGMAIV